MKKLLVASLLAMLSVQAGAAFPSIDSNPNSRKQNETPSLPEGWISAPRGCFDPKTNIACDGKEPYRIEGTNIMVYGGLGWHFFDPKDNKKRREIYGIWIEEQTPPGVRPAGAKTITELAVPVRVVHKDLREVGLAERVAWDPRTRLVTIRLGRREFVYRLPAEW